MSKYGINYDAPHPLFPAVPFRDLLAYSKAAMVEENARVEALILSEPPCMSCGEKCVPPKMVRVVRHTLDSPIETTIGFKCLRCASPSYDQSGFPLT